MTQKAKKDSMEKMDADTEEEMAEGREINK